jgi:hypothetical protein
VYTVIVTITGGICAVLTVIATQMTITGRSIGSVNIYCDINGEIYICSISSYCDNNDKKGEVYIEC